MSYVYFLCRVLLFTLTIKCNHFRGGTTTWKPINNNITGSQISIVITQTYTWTKSLINCSNSMIAAHSSVIDLGTRAGNGVNLTCISNCSTTGGYLGNEVPITGYCTDLSDALDLTVSQRSDIVNLTLGSYFTVAFVGAGGWQILSLGNSTGWSLSSRIDLRMRSDNGLLNSPPVATCISYISIPVGILQTIQIPVLDAINDVVRCRFSNGLSECVNACPPGSLPSGASLTSSCALTITGNTVGDYYLVAVQVEDYLTNSSVTPLSTVPFQFLIYVYAVPSCTLKLLLIGNISSNDCRSVQVGVRFTMTLTAINQCGGGRTMSDIATLSFPILIKSSLVQNVINASLWSLTVTWIPMGSQLGSQLFCAVASDSASVQSDQYCVKFYVGLTSLLLCPGETGANGNRSTTMILTTQYSQTPTSVYNHHRTELYTNDLPLVLGLGLGLGLPLLAFVGLMSICLCCRWCPGLFWKNVRERFWKKKSVICPECQTRHDNCLPMKSTKIADNVSEQDHRQYIGDNLLEPFSLSSSNNSFYASSMPLVNLDVMTTTRTKFMPSRSTQSLYTSQGGSILVQAYVQQEGIRKNSPR